ncbi:hypothetical protein, partial [Oleiphilus sp. HI0123]
MRLSLLFLICLVLTACSTRDLQGTLGGSTAQRLVTHSIDDLVRSIEDEKLDALEGKNVYINSYFLSDSPLKAYADKRLAIELESRFGINVVATQEESEQVMTAFYTSLGTDLDNFGIAIPFGYVPGVAENTQLNIITLEKFHGIAEMYYYIGETGSENRSQVLQAKVKTDA